MGKSWPQEARWLDRVQPERCTVLQSPG
jgi:hypothetical protein